MHMKEEKEKGIPVRVLLRGRVGGQEQNGEYRGVLYPAEPESRLEYREEADDGTQVLCTLHAAADRVRLIRHGVCEMHFVPGQTHRGLYRVHPYAFDLSLTAHVVKAALCRSGGTVELAYTVALGGEEQQAQLSLEIRREEENL